MKEGMGNQTKEHFRVLDGLRGIAVIIVLLSHSSNAELFFHEYLNFSRVGKVGVYLFFVLSAYLLDRQIALTFMSNNSNSLYWKNYFLRRFLRIYPLYTIALISYGILNHFGLPNAISNWKDIPLHLILIRGESIFWSIPVEFKYYIISPILMYFFHSYLRWNMVKVFMIILLLIAATIAFEQIFHFPSVSSFKYFPIFLTGTFVSIYELSRKETIFKSLSRSIFAYSGWIAISLILLSIPFYFQLIFKSKVNFHQSIFYFPYGILWGIVLVSVRYGSGVLGMILELGALRFIGRISFSMYLFHMPVLQLCKLHMDVPDYLRIYLFFLLSTIVATISYFCIEKPLSRVRWRVKKHLSQS